jgi:hypothetical protein
MLKSYETLINYLGNWIGICYSEVWGQLTSTEDDVLVREIAAAHNRALLVLLRSRHVAVLFGTSDRTHDSCCRARRLGVFQPINGRRLELPHSTNEVFKRGSHEVRGSCECTLTLLRFVQSASSLGRFSVLLSRDYIEIICVKEATIVNDGKQ